jgi:hypothetical protein
MVKTLDTKWEKQFGYDIDIEIIEEDGGIPITVDFFSAKIEKDKDTNNEYLVRFKKNDIGEKEYAFKELKPSDDVEISRLVSQGKSFQDYAKVIKDKEKNLEKISDAENKKKKKINFNKKNILDELIKYGRIESALKGAKLKGSYRKRNNYGRPQYTFISSSGVYIPMKWRLKAYLADVANEAKRESALQSRVKTKKQFTATKTNWGQVITWIFTILVFGGNIWLFMHQVDTQNSSTYEELKKENVFVINEFNKMLQENAKICQDISGGTIESLKAQGYLTDISTIEKNNNDNIPK